MATMVTVLLKQKKYRLDAHSVKSCEPAVCFHLDTDEDYLVMHFESPGEMVRFGEQIVGDGLRLMNTTTLAEALDDPQAFVEVVTPLGRTTAEVLADRAAFQEAMGVDDPLPNHHDEEIPY